MSNLSFVMSLTRRGIAYTGPYAYPLLISALLLLARSLFVMYGPLDLAPDEAQYWDWSRLLDWSYTTKPPLTAWLLALSTAILGDTFIGVRFFALLGQAAVPLLAMAIVRQVVSVENQKSAGLWAFALTATAPLIFAGGLMMSPDVPSLVLWLVALYILVALPLTMRSAVLLGLVVGLAGLAKPTAALFFPLWGLYLLWQAPKTLLKPFPYIAGFTALACQIPVFYWNATHHWAMFAHVLDQTDNDGRWQGLSSVLEFLGGQAGVLGPVSFVGLLVTLLWAWKRPQLRLLWVFAAVPFVFFLYASTGAKVQANWPILGMITSVLLLAAVVPAWPRWLKVLLVVGCLINTTAGVLMYDTFTLRALGVKMKIKDDPTKPLLGWRGLGEGLAPILAEYPHATVLTTRYQTTAGLAFHTPQQPHVAYINPGYRRENHYDFTPPNFQTSAPFLYVNEAMILPPQIAGYFEHCTHLQNLEAKRKGVTLRTATVYLCQNAQK